MTKLKCGILAGLLVAGATMVVVMTDPKPSMPNPNGYAFFVKAAQMVGRNSTDPDELDAAQLRALVSHNAEALKVARQGFQYPSRAADNDATNLVEEVASFKQLGNAFYVEGKLAEMENRKEDAIRSYLDYVRLAQETSRGGIMIVRLVGMVVEKNGLNQLQRMAGSVDSNQCKEIVLALQVLDGKEPPLKDILQQEHAHYGRELVTRPNMSVLLWWLEGVFQFNTKASLVPQFTAKLQQTQLALRQTMLAFAVRSYELDKKQRPKSLADLTPDYLNAIPKDPRTGDDMIYAP